MGDWDESNDYSEDVAMYFEESDTKVQDSVVGTLIELAEKHRRLSQELQEANIVVADLEGEIKNIARTQIPAIMDNLGMVDFSLSDGTKIAIQDKVTASIKVENRPRAYEWLEENGFGAIIKTKVMVKFGRGDIEEAKAAHQSLLDRGLDAEIDRDVHHQTLQSFVKERLVDGDSLPDCFGVYEFKEAKIAKPKGRK